jgi:hypothetical protein
MIITISTQAFMMPNDTCGLYYKPITIINDESRVINKLEASLTDDARVIIYDHQMFIVQATENTYITWQNLAIFSEGVGTLSIILKDNT